MPSKKETSSTPAEVDLDEYVRRVLYPWDTQLHTSFAATVNQFPKQASLQFFKMPRSKIGRTQKEGS